MPARVQIKRVLDLAVPAAMQGLVITILMFTDRLVLGWHSTDALASLHISGTAMWSLLMVGTAWTAGAIAVIGRAVGAGDRPRAATTASSAIGLAALLGTIAAALMLPALDPLAEAMAPGPATSVSVRALAVDYMQIILLGMPAAFVASAAMVSLQAGGDTRTPARAIAWSGALNVVLTVPLVLGLGPLPALGATGAAIGTAASFVLQAVIMIAALARNRGPVRLGRPSRSALGPVLRIAGPAMGERVLYQVAFLVFAALVGRLGDVAMTANQALMAIESLGFIGADAFAIVGGTLVAQRLGAEDPDDAARAGWWSTAIGAVLLTGVGVIFFVAARPLIALFTDDPAVIDVGADCLRIVAVAQPLMAAVAALGGSLRGAGDTKTPMLAAIVGPLFIRLGACWWLAFELDMGMIGVCLASTADWLVRTIWLGAAFARGRWRTIRV